MTIELIYLGGEAKGRFEALLAILFNEPFAQRPDKI